MNYTKTKPMQFDYEEKNDNFSYIYVDAFFDSVLVMAKEKKIRNNRLSLLNHIADLFETIADFSKISTQDSLKNIFDQKPNPPFQLSSRLITLLN